MLRQLRNILTDLQNETRALATPALIDLSRRIECLLANDALVESLTKPALLDALEGTVYLLDGERRIVGFGRGFAAFAEINGAPDLADPSRLLGRSIFEFIEGEDVCSAYRCLFDLIERIEGEARAVIFRCDSPVQRRTMRMSVGLLPTGEFLCQSILLSQSEASRAPIALFDFRANAARRQSGGSFPLLPICSMCQQVRVAARGCGQGDEDEWIAAEEYYARGGTSEVWLTHSFCPDCARQWREEWLKEPSPPQNQ